MKDKKFTYKLAGILLSDGEVKEFRDMQNIVSKVNFGRDIGIGYKRMNKLFGSDISSLSLGEIFKTAQILNVGFNDVLYVALVQYQKEVDPHRNRYHIIIEKTQLGNATNDIII